MNDRADFPDWLSPMLVKELRQGLRSRVFLSSFLALQGAMVFLAIIGLSSQNQVGGVTVFFWLIVCIPILITMPFSGLNSISGEKKENTLEPIFLSQLTARRIVLGKWLAIVSQTALLVSAILPYLVLRYYLGGVDLAGEMLVMGGLLVGSAALTGVTVAISPNTGRIGRALLPVALLFVLQFVGLLAASPLFTGVGTFGLHRGFVAVVAADLVIFLLTILFLFCMLEIGAQKIAPAAENHSTPKRLAALGAVVLCGLYTSFWPDANWLWTSALLIIIPVGIGAICEPVREVASVYRPFVRYGLLGRRLGRLFYPGWPSGVLFVLTLLVLIWLVPHGPLAMLRSPVRASISHTLWPDVVAVSIVGAIFVPAALLRLLPTSAKFPPIAPYVLFQTGSAFLALIAHSVAENSPGGLEIVVSMIPSCSLVLAAETHSWDEDVLKMLLGGVTVLTILSLLILFLKMISGWKNIQNLEIAAAEQASPSQNATTSF